MIACIWPHNSHVDQTISTLKFAERMMCVKNKPIVNEVKVGGKNNERLMKQIKLLKEELAMYDVINGRR